MIKGLMREQLRAAWEFFLAMVTRFREERATQTAGSLTYTSLLSMVPLTVDNALNRIFRVQRRRSIVQNIFIYWGVITLGPLLIGASLSGTYVALHRSLGALQLNRVADAMLGVVPFVLTCIALTLL